MLQIEHVTKKYKNFTALTDVNLELETGVYGLLAPNGAGKTTLMKMITTLLFPTEGQIKYNGEDIRKLDGAYREKLGYLPQDFEYYRGLYTGKVSSLYRYPERHARRKAAGKDRQRTGAGRAVRGGEEENEEIFRRHGAACGYCSGTAG